jgi:hypothetical protein
MLADKSPAFRFWLAVVAVFFVASAVSGKLQPTRAAAAAVPVDPAQMGFVQLCEAYRATPTDKLLTAEISRRHEFPPGDLLHVLNGRVFVGMSYMGLVCTRGLPEQTRTYTSSHGTVDWYSYTSPRLLVKFEGGRVESFSE